MDATGRLGHKGPGHSEGRGRLESRWVATSGLVATLVLPPPSERRGAAVVVLGGSRGGLNEQDAIAFADAGFIALALAYFGILSLPRALLELPLEYVRVAIEWLRTQPEVGGRRVGLVGRSKGGELALRVAATVTATERRERMPGERGLIERDGVVLLPVRGRVDAIRPATTATPSCNRNPYTCATRRASGTVEERPPSHPSHPADA